MEDHWSKLLTIRRYLVPKNNKWLKRIYIVFAFILLDYFATLSFCNNPAEEANPYLRQFLENYGIVFGLIIFDFLINLPIYLILCFDSHFVILPKRLSKIVEPLVDLTLAWFLAGAHFSGATSWFWTAPELVRQATGFGIYLIIAIKFYST